MTSFLKYVGAAVLGAVIGVLLAGSGSHLLGGVYNQVAQTFPGLCVGSNCTVTANKLTVGNSGTAIGNIIYGTCYLKADFSISATSTAMVDCVSTSFKSGDTVLISGLATTSTALTRQFTAQSIGSASSTNGYAPVRLTNWSGAAVTPASLNGFGSSTPFVIIRSSI